MYYRGDDSSLNSPKIISEAVLNKFIERVNESISEKNIKHVAISLHGGEPLLAGKKWLSEVCRRLNQQIQANVSLLLQTNGILVDQDWIEIFAKENITIGLSLDGDRVANDANRIDHQAKGTYSRVISGLELLQASHDCGKIVFGGVLAVINPSQQAANLYSHFKNDLGLTNFNVLLPDANHDTFNKYSAAPVHQYGKFLIELYDCYAKDDFSVYIPFFQSILSMIFGGRSVSESVGLMGNSIVVVGTDGGLGAHDVLRINDGYQENANGMTLFNSSIGDVERTPLFQIAAMKEFPENSGVICMKCPVRHICNGGFYGHRYSKKTGYLNHNVYCDALFQIITHIYFDLANRTFPPPTQYEVKSSVTSAGLLHT